jgi:hypothetical protein
LLLLIVAESLLAGGGGGCWVEVIFVSLFLFGEANSFYLQTSFSIFLQ